MRGACEDSVAIELQTTNQPARILNHGEKLPFNQTITKTPYGICYDETTGGIWITICGYYYVSWNISLGGSTDVKEISFSLINSFNNDSITTSTPVALTNQISGNALLKVCQMNQRYFLINSSGGRVQLANTGTQANLVMFRI